jgi:hypothetical protein
MNPAEPDILSQQSSQTGTFSHQKYHSSSITFFVNDFGSLKLRLNTTPVQYRFDLFRACFSRTLLTAGMSPHLVKNFHGSNIDSVKSVNWPGTHVSSEVLTALVMKSSIVCDITVRSPSGINRRCGGNVTACFMLGLHSNREDWSYIFLCKVGWLLTGCTALYPRRQNSSRSDSPPQPQSSMNIRCMKFFPGVRTRHLPF